MIDDLEPALVVLAAMLACIGLSVAMLHLRQRRRATGWVPWNGVLFGAIVIAAIALAHLLGVQQR